MIVTTKWIDCFAKPCRVLLVTLTVALGLTWVHSGYSASSEGDTSNLSFKEKIQLQVKENVQKSVSDTLTTSVAACKAEKDNASCQNQYPFHVLHKEESIANLSSCITKQTLLCISEKLNTAASAPPTH
jgi:hypothetical protein